MTKVSAGRNFLVALDSKGKVRLMGTTACCGGSPEYAMKRDEWIPGIPRIVDVVAGWDFFLLRDESGHLWMGEGEVLRISDVGPSSSGINVLFSPQGGKAIRPERAEELFRVIARASLRL